MAFKISTKGRYGLRALVDLAANSAGRPVLLADIATRQGVSKRYLERLFTRLRRGGLIRSVRGAAGGYLLARDPHEISLAEVVELLEGPIRHADCDGRQPGCRRREKCVTYDLWRDLAETIRAKLAAVTLEDLRMKNEAIVEAEAGRWEI
jgi:Rrf2 family iron-sulfur cluster assembly transcriptional regulator